MKTLMAAFGIAMLGISTAFAQQDIVTFTSTQNGYSDTGTFGFSFQVTSPITVTGLSTYTNFSVAGVPPSGIPVGLWDSSQNELASVTVLPGGPLTQDFFAYANLATPITLADGTYYVGAEVVGGEQDYTDDTVGLSSIPGVTFLADAYHNGPGLVFPGSSAGITAAQGGGDFGGDVVIGSASAPDAGSSMTLLSMGLLGLASIRVRTQGREATPEFSKR